MRKKWPVIWQAKVETTALQKVFFLSLIIAIRKKTKGKTASWTEERQCILTLFLSFIVDKTQVEKKKRESKSWGPIGEIDSCQWPLGRFSSTFFLVFLLRTHSSKDLYIYSRTMVSLLLITAADKEREEEARISGGTSYSKTTTMDKFHLESSSFWPR